MPPACTPIGRGGLFSTIASTMPEYSRIPRLIASERRSLSPGAAAVSAPSSREVAFAALQQRAQPWGCFPWLWVDPLEVPAVMELLVRGTCTG